MHTTEKSELYRPSAVPRESFGYFGFDELADLEDQHGKLLHRIPRRTRAQIMSLLLDKAIGSPPVLPDLLDDPQILYMLIVTSFDPFTPEIALGIVRAISAGL